MSDCQLEPCGEWNLADIVGRPPRDPGPYSGERRVAVLDFADDRLRISENCDECFAIALDRTEVAKLIVFLLDAQTRLP